MFNPLPNDAPIKSWGAIPSKEPTKKNFTLILNKVGKMLEIKKGIKYKIEGYLEEFALSKNEADDLIINARNIIFK